MTQPQINTWQAIQAEVLRRIHAREWVPGQTIPGEVDLAREFGCARATVNRAMQALADAGILERRRKAGTRVALHPVSKVTVDIPVIRQEIEERGATYGYHLISRKPGTHPLLGAQALHVTALHLADGAPLVFEDRWINLAVAPEAAHQSFEEISANEWLITHAPYTKGDIAFAAATATKGLADRLNTAEGAAIFVIDRTTWDHDNAITIVRLSYAPGYQIRTVIGGTI
ncbi:GntR family transcriptional regulator [Roseovarius sp. 2305UL8-3]|uniref:GntR family transcriptional regulator n=1 Tax=Roseovarius conchicola TaxID=3121636 RepID=UPI003528C995